MIIQNNSSTRTYTVGGVTIVHGAQQNVPDEYYDDIQGITDLQLIGVPPVNTAAMTRRSTQTLYNSDGTVYGIVSSDGIVSVTGRINPFTVGAGQNYSFAMKEGDVLTLTGNSTAVGVLTRTGASNVNIGTGVTKIGPFSNVQMINLATSAGSIDAVVADGALAATLAGYSRSGISGGNVATRMLSGRFENVVNNSAGYVWELTLSFAAPIDAIQWIFAQSRANSTASDAPNMLATCYTGSSLADIDAATFSQSVNVGGAGVYPLPAPATDKLMSYVVSDWIRQPSKSRAVADGGDGGRGGLHSCRVQIAAANRLVLLGAGGDSFDNWASRPVSGPMARIRRSTSGGTATTPFVGSLASNSPIVGARIVSQGRVYTIGAWGDSNDEGRDGFIGEGLVLRMAEKINSLNLGFTVEAMNCGWSGASSNIWQANFRQALLAGLIPDLAYYKMYSGNDMLTTVTQDAMDLMRSRANLRLADTVAGTKCRMKFQDCQPYNSDQRPWGATDAIRIVNNRALLGSGKDVLDQSAVVSGSVDGTGQVQVKAGYLIADNIHYNSTAYNALVEANYVKDIDLLTRS